MSLQTRHPKRIDRLWSILRHLSCLETPGQCPMFVVNHCLEALAADSRLALRSYGRITGMTVRQRIEA